MHLRPTAWTSIPAYAEVLKTSIFRLICCPRALQADVQRSERCLQNLYGRLASVSMTCATCMMAVCLAGLEGNRRGIKLICSKCCICSCLECVKSRSGLQQCKEKSLYMLWVEPFLPVRHSLELVPAPVACYAAGSLQPLQAGSKRFDSARQWHCLKLGRPPALQRCRPWRFALLGH